MVKALGYLYQPRESIFLGDLFQHPYPPVEVMRAVKDWAKHCIQQNDESTPPQIASIIYLAAVATALVRCDQRITHSENTDLQVTFRQALGAAWLSRDVRRIFEEAMAQLKREIKKEKEAFQKH